MLKLKLQYFGHLMRRTDSVETTLMLGKIEGRRRRGQQRMRCRMTSLTQWTWIWANSRSWWCTGKPGMLQCWTWLSDWTIATMFVIGFFPRNNCLLISWLQSPSTVILEPKKIKSVLLNSPLITPYTLPHSSIQLIFKFETISRNGHWSFSNWQEENDLF